jgi:hypothetical protein
MLRVLPSQPLPHTFHWVPLIILSNFLGIVAKFRKSDCQLSHVCPYVRMEQLGSHLTDFNEI